jgi:hypothetical protein
LADKAGKFLAAMVAEPSRYATAHITHLLIAKSEELGGDQAFDHMSMTQGGSDARMDPEKAEDVKQVDPRLVGKDGKIETDRKKKVANRDL